MSRLNAPIPADILRAVVTECPNGCPGALHESEHADGLHLTCAECGFWAEEAFVLRLMEKFQ